MEIRKVNVTEDYTALIACPHCGTSRVVNVVKYKNRKDPLKVICTCRQEFSVSLEWRRAFRKEIYLEGYYCKSPECKEWKRIVVRDISEIGIGFATSGPHDVNIGDKLRVKLILDSRRSPIIERNVIVRVAKDKYLGCEFGREFPISTLYIMT